jgi:hypothetical protein
MVRGEVPVTVTREEQHQRALTRYAVAPGGERRIAAELAWCVIASGKYKGERGVEVRVDGQRAGELTHAMSQRYGPLLDGGGRVGCEATVTQDERGLQVTLHLPRDAATAVFAPAAPLVAPPTQRFTPPPPAATRAAGPAMSAWRKPVGIGAAVVASVLILAAIVGGNDDTPSATGFAADETTTTTTFEPTSPSPTTTTTTTATTTTTTTTTTPPPPPPKTTEVVAPPVAKQPPLPPPPPAPKPAPPAPKKPAPPSGCDPNYSGCVPIASDVDCAGGSGNGPAYVQGPVRVVGSDIYDLDRDGDGTACE